MQKAVLDPAPAGSAALYRVWAELLDLCFRMAFRGRTGVSTETWPEIQAVGRSLALENRSRDEALQRMLAASHRRGPSR